MTKKKDPRLSPELRRELTLAKIAQLEPVTDFELAEQDYSHPDPDNPGWWHDPLDCTWRWVGLMTSHHPYFAILTGVSR